MAASRTFHSILEQIQCSNLNFQLQISPFSANISLKKTPIKDKSGALVPPLPSCLPRTSADADLAALAAKNLKLEKDLEILRSDYVDAVSDCESSHQKIKVLEALPNVKTEANETLQKELLEEKDLVQQLTFEIKELKEKNNFFRNKSDSQSIEIQHLEMSANKNNDISNKLNKKLSESTEKFKKEKSGIFKEHKVEVKFWRNELGEVTREKIKLEEKLNAAENLLKSSLPHLDLNPIGKKSSSPTKVSQTVSITSDETLCSICAVSIVNYVPKYFLGEQFNPACDDCQDKDISWTSDENLADSSTTEPNLSLASEIPITPRGFNFRPILAAKYFPQTLNCSHPEQCIIRQPFPPPLPAALTPIVNLHSMYHLKTITGDLDWGSTCSYCMRIEYERYGCESCVWMKTFGNLHGYPDIDPYDFRNYL